MSKPKLIVVSAPSGCGKTTIVKEILKNHPEFYFSVSATTRAKRNNETDGKDYYFITKEEFLKHIENDTLIEWQKIYDDYYGTLVSEVDKSFAHGKSVVFDIDVLGALSIKKKYPEDSILIFIDVPNMDILKERLKNRQTESPETLKKRIDRFEMEMKQKTLFDYIVINDKIQKAVDEVEKIISDKL